MSALIPEQRVDKNGVTVTRHVKPASPVRSGKAFPAPKAASTPKAAPAKKPTKKQLERRLRHMSFQQNRIESDPGLIKELGVSESSRFTASDEDIFSVMSVTSPGNALLLLKAGITTREEAVEKLENLGLARLVEDNTSLAQELLARRIHPENYFIDLAYTNADTPYFMDIVEFHSIDALIDATDLENEIRAGMVKIADIKAFGTARIKKIWGANVGAVNEAVSFLRAHATGQTNTTIAEAKAIFDWHTESNTDLRNAMYLTHKHGSKFGIEIEPTNDLVRRSRRLIQMGLDKEESTKIMDYSLAISDAYRARGEIVKMPLEEDLCRYFEYGASPEDVAKGLTIQQLDAMQNNDISPSVSSGWL